MNRLYLILFIVLLALYGLIEYFMERQRSPELQVRLLKIDTADLSTVRLFAPGETNFLLLTNTEKGWMASFQKTNLRARSRQVDRLLNAFDSLETRSIAGSGSRAKRRLGWDSDEEFLVELRHRNGDTEIFRLFQPPADSIPDTVSAYIQLQGQSEIYSLQDFYPRQLPIRLDDFRQRAFLRLAPEFNLVELSDERRDTLFRYEWTDVGWLYDSTLVLPVDSTRFAAYLGQIATLDGRRFVDNVNEVDMRKRPSRRLLLRGRGRDSVRIELFRDTLLPQTLLLHSSQFPNTWVASDSSGLYKTIFGFPDSLEQLTRPVLGPPLPEEFSDSLGTG